MGNLNAKQVKGLLDYNERTGVLTWKERIGSSGRISYWNRRYAGTAAGTMWNGYVGVLIFSRKYAAHRLAWLIVNGNWPKQTIDHINGNRSDNRICNLREASRAQKYMEYRQENHSGVPLSQG